jgi:hypothetical protein
MGVKWKKRSSVTPSIIVVAVILLLVVIFNRKSTSDAALARHFRNNLATFSELKSMLATNSPVNPSNGELSIWSQEHFHRYQTLMHKARVKGVLQEGPDLRFHLVGPLFPGKGYRIAVAWTETKPDCVITNLDEFHKMGQLDHAYRALGDNWYLWIGK